MGRKECAGAWTPKSSPSWDTWDFTSEGWRREWESFSRHELVVLVYAAAREAGDADFDVLVTWAFNYDAHSSAFNKLGRIPVLKARMNADLHMADELKNMGKGNLFVIFGEPDIDILKVKGDDSRMQVKINEEAWESLHSDTSRPFPKPKSGRIAVKVINHLGDEVMKVFRVE